MSPLEVLRKDIAVSGAPLSSEAWERLRPSLDEARFEAGDVIFSQARIADDWLFLSEGIAASEQTSPEGDASIARFFEPGQFCANLTSAWSRRIAADDLLAITAVEGVTLPDRVFRSAYLSGGGFGEYLRRKVMETLLFDKDLICAKTAMDTETRYRFLEERYSDLLSRTPQKDVARFIGVTPQGLSRFLKHRRERSA